MPPVRSPSASLILLAGAALFLLIQVWRGWRSGLARQLAELLAIACGWVAAYVGGDYLAPMLQAFGFPKPVLRVAAGAVVFGVVYLLITLAAAVLFKKTSQQSLAPVRLFYGLGGALTGLLVGVVYLGALAIGIRLCGSVMEPRAALPHPGLSPWVDRVVAWKQMLQQLPPTPAGRRLDPVPAKTYDSAEQMGAVLASPPAMERFLSFPTVRPLAEHPKIVALRNDPDFLRSAQTGSYLSLLRNPALIQAANDPEIVRLFQRLDFQKALEYALAPAPNPR